LSIYIYSSLENNNNYGDVNDDYNDNNNNDDDDSHISFVVLAMSVLSINSSGHFLTTACLFTGFKGLAYAPELALVLKYPMYKNNCSLRIPNSENTIHQQAKCQWFHSVLLVLVTTLNSAGERTGLPKLTAVKYLIYYGFFILEIVSNVHPNNQVL
jgi:hypothetical protein